MCSVLYIFTLFHILCEEQRYQASVLFQVIFEACFWTDLSLLRLRDKIGKPAKHEGDLNQTHRVITDGRRQLLWGFADSWYVHCLLFVACVLCERNVISIIVLNYYQVVVQLALWRKIYTSVMPLHSTICRADCLCVYIWILRALQRIVENKHSSYFSSCKELWCIV